MAKTDIDTAENAAAELIDKLNEQIKGIDLDVSYGSYDEAVAAAEIDGFADEDSVFVGSDFRVIKDKSELIGIPFIIRLVRFAVDEDSQRPYIVAYCIARFPAGDEMVIFTDGSTGVYKQVLKNIEKRSARGVKRPAEWMNVVNGLRVSEYKLTTENGVQRPARDGEKVTGSATTYYIG